MLVLGRRVGEVICVGESVLVKILRLENGQVKLGIEAPQDVSVDRQEVRTSKIRSRYVPLRKRMA